MIGPEEALIEEVTYLAYHLHWSFDDLLGLGHADRRTLLRQVDRLNRRSQGEDA